MDDDKFDVIIVGAGPAGISAAMTLAQSGENVEAMALERGRYPGAKNMFGGILYSTILNKLAPEFWKEDGVVERHVVRRAYYLLSATGEIPLIDIREGAFDEPPYNNSFTVLRAQFDKWFAEKAEQAGVQVFPDTLVEEIIVEDGAVKGVRTAGERPGELDEWFADVVILAEGANALLVRDLDLRGKRFDMTHQGLGVKEIIALPREIIEDRFNLEGDQGAGLQFVGEPIRGMAGGGFIYTNKESLSVGFVASIRDLYRNKVKPDEVLEAFKSHPCIRPLLRGGESQEYLAHMIPEGGLEAVPTLVMDGLMVVGDAAHLVNSSMYQEGTNMAMASGVMAADTYLDARKKGDFSAATLDLYRSKLQDSFVMRDMKTFRRFPDFRDNSPRFFDDYAKLAVELMGEYFTINEMSKAEIQKEVIRKAKQNTRILDLIRDINRLRQGMGIKLSDILF